MKVPPSPRPSRGFGIRRKRSVYSLGPNAISHLVPLFPPRMVDYVTSADVWTVVSSKNYGSSPCPPTNSIPIMPGCSRTTGSSTRSSAGGGRDLGRRQPQPRQDLQLRLHLLPGRSPQRERNAVRRDRCAAGRARRDARLRDVAARSTRPRSSPRPATLRRLNDIAFSGDGEPTTYQNFDEIIAALCRGEAAAGLDAVKMVLITNASMFHRPHVAARARRSSTTTTAKSGPSSTPAPRSTTT